MEPTAIVVALITVLLGGGGVFFWRAQNQKTKAEATNILVDKALALTNVYSERVESLEQRVCELEKTVKRLEKENASLRDGVIALQKQVVALGGEPVWVLPVSEPNR